MKSLPMHDKQIYKVYYCTIEKISKKRGVGIKFVNAPHVVRYYLPFYLFKGVDLFNCRGFNLKVFEDWSILVENFRDFYNVAMCG